MFIIFGHIYSGVAERISYEFDDAVLESIQTDKISAKNYNLRGLIDEELNKVTHLVEVKNPLPLLTILQLPICDATLLPLGWKYIKANDTLYYLQYLNDKVNGDQFLIWEKGNWVRLFQTEKKIMKEGMFCSVEGDYSPAISKFIQIELNRNVFTQILEKQKVLPILKNTILQMTAIVKNKSSLITGSIILSAFPLSSVNNLVLELWKKERADWVLLSKSTAANNDINKTETKLVVNGKADFNNEIKMLLKLSDHGAAQVSNLDFLSLLQIYAANIMLRS